MAPETWIAIAAASMLPLAIPSTTPPLVLGFAPGRAWRTGAPLATGVAHGEPSRVTLAASGAQAPWLASVLLTSGTGGAALIGADAAWGLSAQPI